MQMMRREARRERERGRENQNHVYDLSQKKRRRDSRRETKKRVIHGCLSIRVMQQIRSQGVEFASLRH